MKTSHFSGRVFLVGGGPGDPKLITLKAIEALQAADVVLYDALANPRLLKWALHAKLVFVGKTSQRQVMAQEEINRRLVALARAGRRVVRLKGGDPLLFGRGGEEAEALAQAGVPFEIIPGVPSGLAAPAYAGIPVTHRQWASGVVFVTGHEDPTKGKSSIDWQALAGLKLTLVIYMGVGRLRQIAETLMAHGRSKETPVAVIRWGTRPDQQTVTGTLATIADWVKRARLEPPAIVVVGDVVKLRNALNWFEHRPLFGRRIVVTRTRQQASELVEAIEGLGGEAVECPLIRIMPNPRALDRVMDRLRRYHWIIFTSANAVDVFMERLWASGRDLRAVGHARFAAIGPGTEAALERCQVQADVVPKRFVSEGLLDALARHSLQGRRVLLPRAAQARDVLPAGLRRLGAQVTVLQAYRVLPEHLNGIRHELLDRPIDAVTFTSSSCAEQFFRLLRRPPALRLLRRAKVVSIGPITSRTLKHLGARVDAEARESTIPDVTQALVETLGSGPRDRTCFLNVD